MTKELGGICAAWLFGFGYKTRKRIIEKLNF